MSCVLCPAHSFRVYDIDTGNEDILEEQDFIGQTNFMMSEPLKEGKGFITKQLK